MNTCLEGIWLELVIARIRYFLSAYVGGLRKTMKPSVKTARIDLEPVT